MKLLRITVSSHRTENPEQVEQIEWMVTNDLSQASAQEVRGEPGILWVALED